MTKQYWILITALLLAALGVGGYFLRRRSSSLEIDPQGAVQGCVKVPSAFIAYTDDFSQVDWGQYAESLEKQLGIAVEDLTQRSYVEGFFKQIDVEPRSSYVKYFRKDLKKYLQSDSALPHWDVEIGALRCT